MLPFLRGVRVRPATTSSVQARDEVMQTRTRVREPDRSAPQAHLPGQAPDEHGHRRARLGAFLCWAVVFADIGTSIYYVPGILYGQVGLHAALFVGMTTIAFILLALKYADIPYATVWDEEVVRGDLPKYDWLHLHHEDFTAQHGKFYAAYHNFPWYQEEERVQKAMAAKLGFAKVTQEKAAWKN